MAVKKGQVHQQQQLIKTIMQNHQEALQQSQTSSIQDAAPIIHHHKYLPDQIPPDWALAAAHAQAVRPGRPKRGAIQACPCCFAYIDKQPLGFNENIKELGFLGQGFPLVLNFMKYCIVMLLVILIDDGIMGIVLSNSENSCNQVLHSSLNTTRLLSDNTSNTTTPTTPHEMTNCDSNYANINAYITDTESAGRRAIKFTSFIAQLLLLIYFRDQQNKLASYIDERTTTMSDYSIRISNIPQGETDNKQRLTRLLKSCDEDCQIIDILLIENLTEYQEEEKVLKEIVEEQKKAHKKGDQAGIAELNQKYVRQKKNLDKLGKAMKNNEKEYFVGEAFIVMNTEEQKEKIIQVINEIEEEKMKEFYPGYNPKENGKISAAQPPQPSQIIWSNIHLRKTSYKGWLLAILMIFAVTVAFFYLIKFKAQLIEQAYHHYTENPTLYQAQYRRGVALGYAIVILINFFNKFIISHVIHYLTDIERHQAQCSYNFSYAMKMMLSMFFTTALMTLLVEAMIFQNYTGSLGVIEEETFMFIFNAYFWPIVWLINPYNMAAWIRRKIMYGNQHITQAEANHIMELPSYNMGKRYAEVIKTVWFTFLYVQIIPLGTVYSLTGMILNYLVDKYVMLNRCSIKDSISSGLSRNMITLLDFTLVLKPAGQMIFDSQLRHTFSVDSLAMLCVGFLYLLLPVDRILQFFNHQNFDFKTKTFESVKDMFHETYFTLYPLTKHSLSVKYFSKDIIELRSQNSSPRRLRSGQSGRSSSTVAPLGNVLVVEGDHERNGLPKVSNGNGSNGNGNGNQVHNADIEEYNLSAIELEPRLMCGDGHPNLPPMVQRDV